MNILIFNSEEEYLECPKKKIAESHLVAYKKDTEDISAYYLIVKNRWGNNNISVNVSGLIHILFNSLDKMYKGEELLDSYTSTENHCEEAKEIWKHTFKMRLLKNNSVLRSIEEADSASDGFIKACVGIFEK